jgi:hypothetical protein
MEADEVAKVRADLRPAPLLALTAPLGRRDCARLAERLGMHEPFLATGGP